MRFTRRCGAPAVHEALWTANQALYWAAFKRVVDRQW